MVHQIRQVYVQNSAESLAGAVKSRIRVIFVAGMLAVALIFGLSFYFAVVSNTTAVARQVPELEAVVSKLKTLLVVNTFVFALIIIASFFVLSMLLTSRLFRPLGTLQEGLMAISKGTLPQEIETASDSPLSSLQVTLKEAIDRLREKETREIEKLSKCIENGSEVECRALISLILQEKNDFLGIGGKEEFDTGPHESTDPLFMQPVE